MIFLSITVSNNIFFFKPQIINFDRGFPYKYKPSILGYHFFWKHPYLCVLQPPFIVFFQQADPPYTMCRKTRKRVHKLRLLAMANVHKLRTCSGASVLFFVTDPIAK